MAGLAAHAPKEAKPINPDLMRVIREFMAAGDWESSQRVVEAHQALLLTPEAEAVFEQNLAQAKERGNQAWLDTLEGALALLRDCRTSGIEAAFAKVKAPTPTVLPFAADLMPRSLAALLGGPDDKRAHARYLAELAATVTDPDYQALIGALQSALVGGDLSQAGQNLRGIYAHAWRSMLAARATGGVEPEQLDAIIHNTRAVLTRAPERKAEWRADLARERRQATAESAQPYAAFLEAVLGLLDAGGNPAGLGAGLQGVYVQLWQTLVEGL